MSVQFRITARYHYVDIITTDYCFFSEFMLTANIPPLLYLLLSSSI